MSKWTNDDVAVKPKMADLIDQRDAAKMSTIWLKSTTSMLIMYYAASLLQVAKKDTSRYYLLLMTF